MPLHSFFPSCPVSRSFIIHLLTYSHHVIIQKNTGHSLPTRDVASLWGAVYCRRKCVGQVQRLGFEEIGLLCACCTAGWNPSTRTKGSGSDDMLLSISSGLACGRGASPVSYYYKTRPIPLSFPFENKRQGPGPSPMCLNCKPHVYSMCF